MVRKNINNRKDFNPFEKPRKRLGELMLDSHYLSEEELEDLIDEQKSTPNVKLGYICLQKGYAETTEVMDALLRQLPVAVPFST